LIDADEGAYGALRVMVNCQQTGQAAGVACALALRDGVPVARVNPQELREALRKQGAAVI
jgi:Holliday junction resolvasome RuvABC endonuclease subunit